MNTLNIQLYTMNILDTLYFFFTDSKGKRLIYHAPIVYKYNFLWYNVGERTTEVGVNSKISKLSTISKLKPKIKLIFGHGTYDIIRKDANNLLNLKTTDNERVVSNIKYNTKSYIQLWLNTKIYSYT